MTLKQTMRVKSRLILWAACLVLVFGAGLVSAQSICDAGSFCDGDGDGFIRDHRRCRGCPGERDCDDSVYNEDNICDGGTSVVYTAELTGAFVFRDELGNPVAMNMFPNLRGNALLSTQTAIMLRPHDSDPLQLTWDHAFEDACPGLGGTKVKIPDILSAFDQWSIQGPGDRRVMLTDDNVLDLNGEAWEVTVQLIGDGTSTDPFLPDPGTTSTFIVHYFAMWGRPVARGGGRRRCAEGGSFLTVPLDTDGTLVITATATQP